MKSKLLLLLVKVIKRAKIETWTPKPLSNDKSGAGGSKVNSAVRSNEECIRSGGAAECGGE